ncbi:hypothetical protein VCV18_004615 [Metarhizium anisopliae]
MSSLRLTSDWETKSLCALISEYSFLLTYSAPTVSCSVRIVKISYDPNKCKRLLRLDLSRSDQLTTNPQILQSRAINNSGNHYSLGRMGMLYGLDNIIL